MAESRTGRAAVFGGTSAALPSRDQGLDRRFQQSRDDLIGIDAVGFCLEVQEDAVAQHRQRDGATSSGAATLRPSSSARAFAPRSRACPARGPAPHRTHLRDQVRRAIRRADGRVARTSRVARSMTFSAAGTSRTIVCSRSISAPDATTLIWILGPGRQRQDAPLFLGRRVVDHDVEHEAIELRFGQRVRPLLLDRILRGEHEERPLQIVAARR